MLKSQAYYSKKTFFLYSINKNSEDQFPPVYN